MFSSGFLNQQTMMFLLAAFLLLIGILGGGFEIKEFKVPAIGTAPRVIAVIVGLGLMLMFFGELAQNEASKQAQVERPLEGSQRQETLKPVEAAKAVEAPKGIRVEVMDHLGPEEIWERITLDLEGQPEQQLNVSENRMDAVVEFTLPHAGKLSYSMTQDSRRQSGTQQSYVHGDGAGTIDVFEGRRFAVYENVQNGKYIETLQPVE